MNIKHGANSNNPCDWNLIRMTPQLGSWEWTNIPLLAKRKQTKPLWCLQTLLRIRTRWYVPRSKGCQQTLQAKHLPGVNRCISTKVDRTALIYISWHLAYYFQLISEESPNPFSAGDLRVNCCCIWAGKCTEIPKAINQIVRARNSAHWNRFHFALTSSVVNQE